MTVEGVYAATAALRFGNHEHQFHALTPDSGMTCRWLMA